MTNLPSTRFLHRWFSVTVSCGVVLILFFGILFYNQPRSSIWQGYAEIHQIPGEYLKKLLPNPLNQSYCKFNYNLPEKLSISNHDIHGTPEESNDYRVLYHVLEVSDEDESVPLVTYATHLTYGFVDYLVEIVRFWDGLVSVAVYLDDGDPNAVLEKIVHFCYCVPAMSRVSLHFVFPKSIGIIVNKVPQLNMTFPSKCDIPPSALNRSNMGIESRKSWYPVNVCRNVARSAAFTYPVMVSDVELIPSKDLATNFLKMLNNYRCKDHTSCRKAVYVVPVFETESYESIPRTKAELVNLIQSQKAVYFHQHVCTHCQKFPGLPKWLESDSGNEVKPFVTTKREIPYQRWEPIYIGTKNEPLYNEVLSWEGFQDKMLQMLEMCLMNYRYVILDGAFLVHWPGMKKIKTIQEPWRKEYIKMNQEKYDAILKNISNSYLPNPRCRQL